MPKKIVRLCRDCGTPVSSAEVSDERFEVLKDTAFGDIDRWGKTDTSPTVKEDVIEYHNVLCADCRKAE